jgi:hypothetical protein
MASQGDPNDPIPSIGERVTGGLIGTALLAPVEILLLRSHPIIALITGVALIGVALRRWASSGTDRRVDRRADHLLGAVAAARLRWERERADGTVGEPRER